MQFFAAVGLFSFVVVGFLVGARLLWLARQTGEQPERLLGISLLLYAGVGQPLLAVSRPLGAAFGYEARLTSVCVALAAYVAGVGALLIFTRVVFRPEVGWAKLLVGSGIALAGLSAMATGANVPRVAGEFPFVTKLGIALLAVAFCFAMAWTAVESLSYYGRMRRRMAIGLAEPLVANRFLLWGVGTGVTALVPIAMIAAVAAGLDIVVGAVPILLSAFGGFVVSGCWALAFFPPAGYARWVEARAAA